MGKILSFFNLERTVALAVLAIASWQLLTPPALGVADNGDFARLMVFFDLTHAPKEWGDRYFSYFNRHYATDRVEARKYASPDFISSELVFVAAALGISRLAHQASFDLLLLGTLHVALFVGFIYMVLTASRTFWGPIRTISIILGTLVFTDIAYIAYFNSFYCESATFLFFLLVVGCVYGAIGSARHSTAWIAAYFLAVTGFLLAKYQNLILLPVFLTFGWLLLMRRADVKRFHVYLVFALLTCYASYRFCISAPSLVDDAVLFNSVFDGILADSPTPREDLAALGLDPELARYARSTAFQSNSPRFDGEFMRTFREKVNIGEVCLFYVHRPMRLMRALNRTVRLTVQPRPVMGNYEKISGFPPGARSRDWAMWSSVRAAVLPKSLVFVVAAFIVYLGLLTRGWLREKDPGALLNLEWSAMIVPMALLQLGLITVSDGITDAIKHAFLFNLLLDYALVAIVTALLTAVTSASSQLSVKDGSHA